MSLFFNIIPHLKSCGLYSTRMYKSPKGTQDLVGEEQNAVKDFLRTCEEEFQKNGGQPLETPVFERTDILLGKQGDEAENKLLQKLEDQGGELLSLRQDLTVPFTRYLKEKGVKQMRRYAIGKVYRRDQPNPGQGRYREFQQADFDIVGEKQDGMIAEAMLLAMVSRILSRQNLDFKIYVNSIPNLQEILIGLCDANWKKLCPIIDKLDKQSFDSLAQEFLSVEPTLNLEELRSRLNRTDPQSATAQNEFAQLQENLAAFGWKDRLQFSNSLARGLDYQTGWIWEIKVAGHSSSISAGGRYDILTGLPTLGISLGVSRIIQMLGLKAIGAKRESQQVTTLGEEVHLKSKLEVVAKLQTIQPDAKIVQSLSSQPRKLTKILSQECQDIDQCVIVAEKEYSEGKILVKNLKTKEQTLLEI